MHYSIYLLLRLIKSFIAILPFCLFTTCTNDEPAKEQTDDFHPIWSQLNEQENNLMKDKCVITKLGLGRLRFHAPSNQQSFNSNNFYKKSQNNIVETDMKDPSWVLTPNFYGHLMVEKFPKTMQTGMKYRAYNDKEGGIPPSFLEEWLAIDPIDYRDALLIISTGLEGKLGVSELLKEKLKDKQEKGEIQNYKILKSRYAVKEHNKCVKEGKKVFTFIHTVG